MPELIDIHCHLDFEDFEKDREVLIKKTIKNDIWIINIGTNAESSQKVVKIANSNKGVYAIVGLHPHDVKEGFDKNYYRKFFENPKVLGIGECGLDFFKIKNSDRETKNNQREIFSKQIELALEVNKPLMIHCRDAHKEAVEILKNFKKDAGEKLRGNIHFFSGNIKYAEEYLSLGFYLSFTGVITFTQDYDEIIKKIPLNKIMIETDAPFVSPIPYRGKRCEPLYVKYVAEKLAELRGIDFKEICSITTANAKKLFGI